MQESNSQPSHFHDNLDPGEVGVEGIRETASCEIAGNCVRKEITSWNPLCWRSQGCIAEASEKILLCPQHSGKHTSNDTPGLLPGYCRNAALLGPIHHLHRVIRGKEDVGSLHRFSPLRTEAGDVALKSTILFSVTQLGRWLCCVQQGNLKSKSGEWTKSSVLCIKGVTLAKHGAATWIWNEVTSTQLDFLFGMLIHLHSWIILS